MLTQKRILFAALGQRGWTMNRVDDHTLEWWADEAVVLTLPHPPQTKPVYLTFVVDPQWDGPRTRGQGVWAATAALNAPMQWSTITLSLGRGWQQHLPQFLNDLTALSSED